MAEGGEVNSGLVFWWRKSSPSTVFVARLWYEAREMAATVGTVLNQDEWTSGDVPTIEVRAIFSREEGVIVCREIDRGVADALADLRTRPRAR